ncbi:MAG: hypothetical protein ACXU8N_22000 [Telluria sp.]|jgi:hypothetical protein
MNHLVWIGIIVWGILMSAFGLATVGAEATPFAPDLPAQDIALLVAGGLLSCLIGVLGLLGLMGWIPGFHKDKQTVA